MHGGANMNLAQLGDEEMMEKIAEQEARLIFDQFGFDTAHQVGEALVRRAKASSLPVVVDITRSGQCLFHYALPGTTPDNAEWVLRKNRVVQRFHRSSLYMGTLCRVAGTSLEEKFLLPPHTYAAHGGSFPITVKGSGVVGTITVSGLPQIDDHNLVVSVIESILFDDA